MLDDKRPPSLSPQLSATSLSEMDTDNKRSRTIFDQSWSNYATTMDTMNVKTQNNSEDAKDMGFFELFTDGEDDFIISEPPTKVCCDLFFSVNQSKSGCLQL